MQTGKYSGLCRKCYAKNVKEKQNECYVCSSNLCVDCYDKIKEQLNLRNEYIKINNLNIKNCGNCKKNENMVIRVNLCRMSCYFKYINTKTIYRMHIKTSKFIVYCTLCGKGGNNANNLDDSKWLENYKDYTFRKNLFDTLVNSFELFPKELMTIISEYYVEKN